MSNTRFFALAIRRAPKQLWPTSSHATTPICYLHTNSFDSGASHARTGENLGGCPFFSGQTTPSRLIRSSTRWVHTSRRPDETIKKTEEKNNGGEAERTKTVLGKDMVEKMQRVKSRQELKKLVAVENEMVDLEKEENEVTEKLVKEMMYFDKLGSEWAWKIKGLKSRQEVEKEFQEKLKKERENWERLQRELTEGLERLKAYGDLENEREEVMRKVRMKKDERDEAVKLLVSSYQDVLSSPPTPRSS